MGNHCYNPTNKLTSPDEDLENILLTRSPRFQALLARSRQSVQEGKSLSEDDFWQAVAQQTAQSQP